MEYLFTMYLCRKFLLREGNYNFNVQDLTLKNKNGTYLIFSLLSS